MRASTPADQMGPVKPIPQPKFKIGDMVKMDFYHASDRIYYARQYLRYLLRKERKLVDKMRAEGFLDPGSKLPAHIKHVIQECIARYMSAEVVQIAGIVPQSMYNIDCVNFNECYVGGVSGASSPMRYEYHILIRFKDSKGNRIALVTGIPVGSDNCFKLIEG